MLQRRAAEYVARPSVGEGPAADEGTASQVDLLARIQARLLLEPMHHVGPNNVRVGLSKYVPLTARAHLPGLLKHRQELVLVQVPCVLSLRCGVYTLLLRDVTLLLATVEVEIGDSIFISLVNFCKSIVQVIWADLLFLSKG